MGSYSISIHKFGDGIKFTKIQILLIPSKLPFLSLSRGVYSSILTGFKFCQVVRNRHTCNMFWLVFLKLVMGLYNIILYDSWKIGIFQVVVSLRLWDCSSTRYVKGLEYEYDDMDELIKALPIVVFLSDSKLLHNWSIDDGYTHWRKEEKRYQWSTA